MRAMGRKYWQLSQVATVMILARMALLLVKLPRILTWLSIPKIPNSQNFELIQDVNFYCFYFFRIFPANPKGNCLPRSLILYWFARRCGFPVRFHCGVRWIDTALDGHAWLSVDGQPFLEPKNLEEEGYQETYSYPALPRPTGTLEKNELPAHHDASITVPTGSPVDSTVGDAEWTRTR